MQTLERTTGKAVEGGMTSVLRPGSRAGSSQAASQVGASERSGSTQLGPDWDNVSIASSSAALADDIFQLKFGGACDGPSLVLGKRAKRMIASCAPLADKLPAFVFNLKNRVAKEAEALFAAKPHQTRLQLHRTQATQTISQELLTAHFQKYVGGASSGVGGGASAASRSKGGSAAGAAGSGGSRLPFKAFAQALSHFREPGQPFPGKATVERLWLACDRGNFRVLIASMYAGPEKQVGRERK
jgi:hypothetical protein